MRYFERDPGLTLYGILTCLSKAYFLKDTNRYKSDVVFVSCLKRTWMTAILLYAFSHEDKISIKITPYLKEVDTFSENGNSPKLPQDQIKDMQTFFRGLVWLKEITNKKNNKWIIDYFENLQKKAFELITMDEKGKSTVMYEFTMSDYVARDLHDYRYYQSTLYSFNIVSKPMKKSSYVKTESLNPVETFPKYNTFFLESDLQKFMDFIKKYENLLMVHVHCITHSNAMKKLCKQFVLSESDREGFEYPMFARSTISSQVDATNPNSLSKQIIADLSEMNIWDLKCAVGTDGKQYLKLYRGAFVPHPEYLIYLSNESCEQNCDFSKGIGAADKCKIDDYELFDGESTDTGKIFKNLNMRDFVVVKRSGGKKTTRRNKLL
jgi:hypothetical protein